MRERSVEKSPPNYFKYITRRRMSCHQYTQMLWDALKMIRNSRGQPTTEKIMKLMQKEFGSNEGEVTKQLDNCVRDGLLEVTKKTVSKGPNAGSEQCFYRLPLLKLKDDDYDWYCFICHDSGDVIRCTKPGCLKVYHLGCLNPPPSSPLQFVCDVCKMCQKTPDKFTMKRSKFNRLLGIPLAKLKSKYPLTLKDQRLPPPNKNILVSDRVAQALAPPAPTQTDESDNWRTFLLIAREMNLYIVEEKIDRHRYKLLEEFHADCLNIVHNIVIYNGVDSAVADIARQMLRDCVEYLNEIRQCVDCFKFSHGQKKISFTKPCRKPHELVYAKQSGESYWPAKVLKVEGDQYDVRLFGPPHPRVQVSRNNVKPITASIHSLQVKRSSQWNRATDELKKHQEQVERWRISTREFTVFEESSSSEESDSVDSDTQRKMEKDFRVYRMTQIIDKQDMTSQKQKSAARRSSTTRPPTGERKRGRPRLSDPPVNPKLTATPKSAGRPNRKRTYSSDSLDSFNAPVDPLPKKDTNEMFDELLKSEPTTASSSDKKGKSEPARRAPVRALMAKAAAEKRDISDDSKNRDSSTFSSQDGSRRTKTYTSSDDSESDSDLASSLSAKVKPMKRPSRPKKVERKLVDSSSSSDSDPPAKISKTFPNGKADVSSSSSDSDSDDDDDDDDDEDDEDNDGKSTSNKSKVTPARAPVKAKAKTDDNQQARRSGRIPVVGKEEEKPAPAARSSQRNLRKSTETKHENKDDSSDSETPLRKKSVGEILLKYSTRPPKSSESESKSNPGSDSETDVSVHRPKKVETVKKVVVKPVVVDRKSKDRRNTKEFIKDAKEEIVVSSSSQEPITRSVEVQTDTVHEAAAIEHSQELKNSVAEQIQEWKNRFEEQVTKYNNDMERMKGHVERVTTEHEEYVTQRDERENASISEIKKKQWCYNCEQEAIYHCCWNTAYCSVECQQAHWQTEHKRVCRRKRYSDRWHDWNPDWEEGAPRRPIWNFPDILENEVEGYARNQRVEGQGEVKNKRSRKKRKNKKVKKIQADPRNQGDIPVEVHEGDEIQDPRKQRDVPLEVRRKGKAGKETEADPKFLMKPIACCKERELRDADLALDSKPTECEREAYGLWTEPVACDGEKRRPAVRRAGSSN